MEQYYFAPLRRRNPTILISLLLMMIKTLKALWKGHYSIAKILCIFWPSISLFISLVVGFYFAVYFVLDSFQKAGLAGIFFAFFAPVAMLEIVVVFFIPALIITAFLLLIPLTRAYRQQKKP